MLSLVPMSALSMDREGVQKCPGKGYGLSMTSICAFMAPISLTGLDCSPGEPLKRMAMGKDIIS